VVIEVRSPEHFGAMSDEPSGTPLPEPDWLRQFREEHRWTPPDPADPAVMQIACRCWFDDYIVLADEHAQRDIGEDLKRFQTTTQALADCAEAHTLDSTPLITFLQRLRDFQYDPESGFPTPDSGLQVLLDRLAAKLRSEQPSSPNPPEAVAPQPPAQAVLLKGRADSPIVRGKTKRTLTHAQFDIIEALLQAGEAGLTKDEFERKSRHSDARRILKRLAESDPDWNAVILFPGRTGGRYRISP
jgi:hypothetical protein